MKKKTILTSAGYVTIRLSRQVWRFSLLRSFILAMLCAVILMGCSTDNDDNPAVRPEYTGNSRFQMPGDDAWNSAMLEKIRDVNKIR